jgi:hypothetical protein
MIRRRPKVEWRQEQGPDYDLRQYQGGRPTGLVAVTGWDHGAVRPAGATGPEVRLYRTLSTLVAEERRRPGVRLRLPIQSCVDARLAGEPGLPGTALLRLTLTVRFGQTTTFTVSLWFPPRSRPFLQGIVDEIAGRKGKPDVVDAPVLPPLEVAQAPDDEDWVVFRPANDGEVLRRRDRTREGGGHR